MFGKFELSPFDIKIRTYAFELITVHIVNILNNDQSTFLCAGDSSKTDLVIATNSLRKKCSGTTVDDETELFTGALNRGHLPVISASSFQQQKNVREAPNWTKSDRTFFYQELEQEARNWSSDHRVHQVERLRLWQTVLDMMNRNSKTE